MRGVQGFKYRSRKFCASFRTELGVLQSFAKRHAFYQIANDVDPAIFAILSDLMNGNDVRMLHLSRRAGFFEELL